MARRRRSWLIVVLALLLFAGLATLPFMYQGNLTPWVQAAQRTTPVSLGPAPLTLPQVQLSAVALPAHPEEPPVSQPVADSTHMAALVAAEDLRLRTLQHHTSRLTVPVVIPVRGGLPTLVLRGRPASYSITDLQNAGALVPLRQGGGFLLVDSVLVATKPAPHGRRSPPAPPHTMATVAPRPRSQPSGAISECRDRVTVTVALA